MTPANADRYDSLVAAFNLHNVALTAADRRMLHRVAQNPDHSLTLADLIARVRHAMSPAHAELTLIAPSVQLLTEQARDVASSSSPPDQVEAETTALTAALLSAWRSVEDALRAHLDELPPPWRLAGTAVSQLVGALEALGELDAEDTEVCGG